MFLLFALYACFVHPVGYGYGRASFYGAEQLRHNHHRPMANGRQFDANVTGIALKSNVEKS